MTAARFIQTKLLGRRCRRGQILARRDIRNIRQVRDLSSGRIVDADAFAVQQRAGSAVEFNARLLVCGRGRQQRDPP